MFTIYPETGEVIRNEDGRCVAPCQSADDPDFIAYIDWVNAGNQPTVGQVILPPTVPQSASPRQIRLALNQMGVRAEVEAAVLNSSQDIKDSWEFAVLVNINDPFFVELFASLNVDLDQLFILASSFPE